MKKSVLMTCVLMAICQTGYATSNRIAALGGSTAMITDDDTNIDLFPQTINRQNFFRLSGIDGGSPDYAILTGNPGDKWGLYGGTSVRNDFLNVYRSLGNDSAIKLGFKVGRHSLEQSENNKEATVVKSEEKNSYIDLAMDATYGKNMGEREVAARAFFAYGPHTIDAVVAAGGMAGPHGTYEASQTNGATKTDADGEGNNFALGGTAFVRQPMQVAMFTKAFASAGFSYASTSSDLSSGSTKLEDYSDSTIQLFGSVLLFDEKTVAENTRVFYGLGGGGFIYRMTGKDKPTSEETKETILRITGPQIRLGMENKIKYGKLRFGIYRDIDIFNYDKKTETPKNGTNNDDNSETTFDLIRSGSYSFAAGYGMEYKNLKIDITLSNNIWVRGPQMIFDTGAGAIGASADVIYTY